MLILVAITTLLLLGHHHVTLKRFSRSDDTGIDLKSKTDITAEMSIQVQATDSYVETHAIFLISFGEEAAESSLVERCVLSLRRRGNWTGHIVLLTDASYGRYEQGWKERNNITVIHPKEEHFNGADGKQLKFNRQTVSLKVKRFKTFVLDYIEMDKKLSNIKTIYYIDIDIIAGGDLHYLFRGVESKQQIGYEHPARGGEITSTLHFFTPMSRDYPFQSGTFVVDRHSSKRCLELWRREIENNIALGTVGMDQAALRTLYHQIEAGDETRCMLKRIDNEGYLSFLKPRNFDIISQSSSHTVLIHLSNSKFAKWIDEEDQNTFLYTVLQLSEEERQSGKYGKSVIKLN